MVDISSILPIEGFITIWLILWTGLFVWFEARQTSNEEEEQ